jgi:hypothetical protein
MSKEIKEEEIEIAPKQMDFTVVLPDREKQWEKCVAYVVKTKLVTQSTTEVIDDVSKTVSSDPIEVSYIEMAVEDKGTDLHGEPLKEPIKLSDVAKKVDDAVAIIDIKPVPEDQSKEEKAKIAVADSLTTTFADDKGIIDEKKLKELATWGLGCPGNCGYFWEFKYVNIVPQRLHCPQCGVNINLVIS